MTPRRATVEKVVDRPPVRRLVRAQVLAMLVDFTLVNANHAFSFLQKLPRVRSLADFAELSAEHARQQMAAWSNQAQQLTKTIAQKAIPADNSTAR